MESIGSLIEAFGGVTKFGRAIGKRCEHVGSMRARGSIPSRYWLDLVESVRGRELGLSLDDLARLNANGRPSLEITNVEAPI